MTFVRQKCVLSGSSFLEISRFLPDSILAPSATHWLLFTQQRKQTMQIPASPTHHLNLDSGDNNRERRGGVGPGVIYLYPSAGFIQGSNTWKSQVGKKPCKRRNSEQGGTRIMFRAANLAAFRGGGGRGRRRRESRAQTCPVTFALM